MTEPTQSATAAASTDTMKRSEGCTRRHVGAPIAYDDVLIFHPCELGPAGSPTCSQTIVGNPKMLFRPTGIVIEGCDLTRLAVDAVKVANQEQGVTSAGYGAGGPYYPAEVFAPEHAGLLPWAMDTCHPHNQCSVSVRNLDPERSLKPRVMFLGEPTDKDLAEAMRGTLSATTEGGPTFKRRAAPVVLRGYRGDACEPGQTIDLGAEFQQEFDAVHLVLTEETAAAFDVIDVSTSTEERPARVCREPRPGILFAPSSPTRLTLRMPRVHHNQSIVVTLKNVSGRKQTAQGVLWGHMIFGSARG